MMAYSPIILLCKLLLLNCRKQELYSMEWSVDIDPEKFLIAVAPYGGPIGEYLAHIQDTMYDAGVT